MVAVDAARLPLRARRAPAAGVPGCDPRPDHAGADRGVAGGGDDPVHRRGRRAAGAPPASDGAEDARDHARHLRARKAYGLHLNPAAEVEQIKHTYDGSVDFYSPDEVWALVRAADSEQDAAIYLTAAFAGLRRGELVALRVRDVDFGNRVLRVEGSYSLGVLKAPKSGKVRSVPMAVEVEKALARLLVERGNPRPDDLVFPGEGGGYLDASALRRRYTRAQTKARLRGIRFHDLRHTFGSLAINRVSLVDVQAWMGHADIKTTMRYLHHKSRAADAELLDGAFAPESPTEDERPTARVGAAV